MECKIIAISAYSVSLELLNNTPYYSDSKFDVYVNNDLKIKTMMCIIFWYYVRDKLQLIKRINGCWNAFVLLG